MDLHTFPVAADQVGRTLAAVLRERMPDCSWSEIKQMVAARRARIDGEICVDPARRLREGQTVVLAASAPRQPRKHPEIVIRHLDQHVVVVEKPSGLCTVRHPSERNWPARRKALHPTLEDLVPALIAGREKARRKGPLPRLRIVHRLDKETSGLLVFARTPLAESALGRQFRKHTVVRKYLAVIPGSLATRRIESRLIADRGDGRRGSTSDSHAGKAAVTHVEPVEHFPGFSVMACRLETGRTHQIRIHLAESGHPVCGEKVYNRRPGEAPRTDASGAPRLALHAAELGFTHPASGEPLHWKMPIPPELMRWLAALRKGEHVC
jgi:23S rRNA pseudouridine1911/1915/1917 synthase